MRNVFVLTFCFLMIGCNQEKQHKTKLDSSKITKDSGNITVDSSKCDENFYSFFLEFIMNKDFQLSRAKIKNWNFINLYLDKEYSLEMFETNIDVLTENNKDLIKEKHLTFLSISDTIITDYVFKKIDCKWLLMEKNNILLKNFIGKKIIFFIEKFSTNSGFMKNHIKYPLKFQFLDDDYSKKIKFFNKKENFSDDFFEKGYILILNSGNYSNLSSFNIALRGINNGLKINSFFEKQNETWILVEVNDFSN